MFILLWMAALSAGADPALKPSEQSSCAWTAKPPVIDGKADDDCWKRSKPITNFHLPWLGKKDRPAASATRAMLAWDHEHLYFFARMEDGDLFADVTVHDGVTWNNDVFEIFLKPSEAHGGYYEFQVNAANTVFDCFFPKRDFTDFENRKKKDRFHVESKVALEGTLNKRDDRDKSWSVEGKIPWTDFAQTGGPPNPGEAWKFALCRYDYDIQRKEPELSTSAPLASKPHADFHLVEDYASLVFEGPVAAWKTPVRIPADQQRFQGAPEPPPPYKTIRAFPDLSLKQPVCAVFQPGSNLMLAAVQDKPYTPCTIVRFEASPEAKLTQKLLDFKDSVYDIAFHPDFSSNGFIYFGCNGPNPDGKKYTRVLRYRMDTKPPHNLHQDSRTLIMEWFSDGHNGGAIAFGKDGMLYITSGDGTSDSDGLLSGQDLSRPLGKVLRIDVDHPDEGRGYSIPKDNPFYGQKDAVWETWALGLRNPWRMHCDKKSGDIWVGNNGQDLWEQVYLVNKGDNYGWSVIEGVLPFYPTRKPGPLPFAKPAANHHHSEARSLTGGIVYQGDKFKELKGFYLYGDYSTGKIWAIRNQAGKVTAPREIADTSHQIVCFTQDDAGDIYVVDHVGSIHKLSLRQTQGGGVPFPRKLSESNLFASVKGHVTRPELIPYSVNAPFWSDGAVKVRYIALPEKDDKGNPARIEYTQKNGWNFPNGSVLVKSFSLPAAQNPQGARIWIETRLLVRYDNEWAGYSYIWNKEQTDADLVESPGRDVEYAVPGAVGGKQMWHYPSRAECMVCHSRAANYVLGLTELQMNKVHQYPSGDLNQLDCLKGLGLLQVNSGNEYREAVKARAGADGLKDKELETWLNGAMNTPNQRRPVPNSSLLPFNPDSRKRLVDPYDKIQPLESRARSFLHANCSNCHVEAGGGNSQINLEFLTEKAKLKLFDEKPHHHALEISDARLVAPGQPDKSVLLKRISIVGPGQMPQIGRNLVDRDAVDLLRQWIGSLPK